MEFWQEEYTADGIIIKFICTEIVIEYEISNVLHSTLCKWAVETLNSADSRNDITRLQPASKIAKAHELVIGEFQ